VIETLETWGNETKKSVQSLRKDVRNKVGLMVDSRMKIVKSHIAFAVKRPFCTEIEAMELIARWIFLTNRLEFINTRTFHPWKTERKYMYLNPKSD